MTRHLHWKFTTVMNLYTKLIKEFREQVPNNLTFAVGYLEGQKHSKVSIATNDDLRAMYSMYPTGEITLWCDTRSEENVKQPLPITMMKKKILMRFIKN